MEIGKVTESRKQNGSCECKSPWHSLKLRREGDRERQKERETDIIIEVQGVKMKRILSFYTCAHTLSGYQELPLTSLCFIISNRASGKDTLHVLCSSLVSHPCFYPTIHSFIALKFSQITGSFFPLLYLLFFPPLCICIHLFLRTVRIY